MVFWLIDESVTVRSNLDGCGHRWRFRAIALTLRGLAFAPLIS
jgi:hypothetical protein